MWVVRTILIVLVIVFILAFGFYNNDSDNVVDVNLIYWHFADVPMVIVVLWSFVVGLIVSILLFISVYIKLAFQVRSSKRTISALESEVTVLRNRPIEESADLLKGADDASSTIDSPFTRASKES